MNPNSMLEQMLHQQFSDQPQWQTLLSMMQQRQAEQAAEREEEEEKSGGQAEKHRLQMEKAAYKIKQMKSIIDGLRLHIGQLEDFQEEMAHALGACVYCMGEDASCKACRGKGKPGAFEPDEALFRQWIAPALRRMNALAKEMSM